MGFRGNLRKYFQNFLSDMKARVCCGDSISDPYLMTVYLRDWHLAQYYSIFTYQIYYNQRRYLAVLAKADSHVSAADKVSSFLASLETYFTTCVDFSPWETSQ